MPTSGSYRSLTPVLPPPPDLGLPSSNKLFLLGHLCHSLGLQSKGHKGSGWLPHGSDSFDSLLASSLTPLSTRSSTAQATIVQRQDGGSGPVPHPHMPSLLLERSSQNTRALESHSALRTKSGLSPYSVSLPGAYLAEYDASSPTRTSACAIPSGPFSYMPSTLRPSPGHILTYKRKTPACYSPFKEAW